MDGNYVPLAEDCMKKAQSKMSPGVFGRVFGSKSQRLEEACDLYKQAANYYRLAKDC